jgi:hypothetical protein
VSTVGRCRKSGCDRIGLRCTLYTWETRICEEHEQLYDDWVEETNPADRWESCEHEWHAYIAALQGGMRSETSGADVSRAVREARRELHRKIRAWLKTPSASPATEPKP